MRQGMKRKAVTSSGSSPSRYKLKFYDHMEVLGDFVPPKKCNIYVRTICTNILSFCKTPKKVMLSMHR